ncbi:response regulator transcription factor [Cognatishimia sp.]|uniref:response regulator transcription factor n=1 Tax=Cognatishimia sp. TaxID=2211648 RepID=UPI003511F89B
MRIVIIEDNQTLAEGMGHVLRDDGHSVDILFDGQEGLDFLKTEDAPDLIILDINLPSIDGLALISTLRKGGLNTPCICLSALGETDDRIAGLDAGGDDYLVKPFEMAELKARIRALMRRKPSTARQDETFGRLNYDRATRLLSHDGQPLALPKKELATFECLYDRVDQMVSKATLASHLYGTGADVEEKVVEVYISRLRKRLSAFGIEIHTARGLGYMIKESSS